MIVLDPDRLAAIGDGELNALAAARQCVVSIADGRVAGAAAAALLMSDFAAATQRSVITLDSPPGWAGAVWRIGDEALWIACDPAGLAGTSVGRTHEIDLAAGRALAFGLVDELFSGLWTVWLDGWLAHRSVPALDSAALLTGRRGGDALERAEFARLFATGEPQHGMDAFLAKRRPRFIT